MIKKITTLLATTIIVQSVMAMEKPKSPPTNYQANTTPYSEETSQVVKSPKKSEVSNTQKRRSKGKSIVEAMNLEGDKRKSQSNGYAVLPTDSISTKKAIFEKIEKDRRKPVQFYDNWEKKSVEQKNAELDKLADWQCIVLIVKSLEDVADKIDARRANKKLVGPESEVFKEHIEMMKYQEQEVPIGELIAAVNNLSLAVRKGKYTERNTLSVNSFYLMSQDDKGNIHRNMPTTSTERALNSLKIELSQTLKEYHGLYDTNLKLAKRNDELKSQIRIAIENIKFYEFETLKIPVDKSCLRGPIFSCSIESKYTPGSVELLDPEEKLVEYNNLKKGILLGVGGTTAVFAAVSALVWWKNKQAHA